MKALILAAGEGTRLGPLTAERPKPMLPVGGVPLIEHIVLLLKRHGVSDIAINLHYKPWTIIHHLGHGRRWGVRIHYSFEEALLGSAGAAKRLEWYFDESFIVFYGDLYTDLNLSNLIAAHRQGGAPLTMALYAVDNPTQCGIVELDEQSRVRRFVEKPAPDQVFSRLANAGVLVIEPAVLDLVPAEQNYDFGHDVFPRMLATDQSIVGYPITETLIDIGTPENYQKAQQLVAQQATLQPQPDLLSQIVAPTVHNVFSRFVFSRLDQGDNATHTRQ
jgi:NDP-sugar pyrophosphorylase family protein